MPSTKPDESKHSTTGTFTASIDVDGNFVGNPLEMRFYKDTNFWHLAATERPDSHPQKLKGIDLYVPGDIPGDGKIRTYQMQATGPAAAAYWRYEDGGHSPYTSVEGTLTVAYDAVKESMSGSFDCKASFGSKQIAITNARFDLRGIMHPKHVLSRTKQGQLTATLEGGISQDFASDTMTVKYVNQELAISAHQLVWEPLPPKHHRITLFIKDGVNAGLHTFGKGHKLIRAAYVTPGKEPEVFEAISGELYLAVDPTDKHLKGTLTFEAEGIGSPDHKASVKDGKFLWQE